LNVQIHDLIIHNECALLLDLEWKMIYVGSAESEEHDQILDTIYVGPIPEGKHMFVFQV
jgi:histone chaperone ASF1